jgi:hypothetical protein
MAIYLSGHGSWEVQEQDTPWAKVPRGTKIHFYTENAKTLRTAAMVVIAVERGDTPLPAAGDLLGETNGTFEQYKSCPNYTLFPDTPDKNQVIEAVIGTGNVIFVNAAKPLCTGIRKKDGKRCMDSDDPLHDCDGLFADPRVVGQEIVWLACRALGLEDVGGRATGVDAPQYELGEGAGTEFAEESRAAWVYFNRATPDDFWTYFCGLSPELQMSCLTINPIRDRLIAEGRDLGTALQSPIDQAGTDAVTQAGGPLPEYGDTTPQGVQQCAEVCATCGEQCRWGVEHQGSYDHECPNGDTW